MPSQAEDMDKLRAEVDRLTQERDLWKARAFAMFWKLPGDLTIGQLQEDADRALMFVRSK